MFLSHLKLWKKLIDNRTLSLYSSNKGIKKMKTKITLLILSILMLSCTSSNKYKYDKKYEPLNEFIEKVYKKGGFNGAVLIADNGNIQFMKTYGYSDLETSKPLSFQSSFRLASVSKQFTSMAIMILKERELLNFDDKVQKYIPELLIYPDITIRHLLNHSSGLPDYETFTKDYIKDNEFLTIPKVLKILQEKPIDLNFTPGSKFKYSNTGYIFLSELISRVSGKSFEVFLDENIFIPLGMKNSKVWNLQSLEPYLKDRVIGYTNRIKDDYTNQDGVSGDGAVFVSIEDFLLWDNALRENSLISKSTWIEAISPGILNNGKQSYYGFGWILSNNGKYIYHTGGWCAARTYIYKDLETGLLIVILDSSSTYIDPNLIKSMIL